MASMLLAELAARPLVTIRCDVRDITDPLAAVEEAVGARDIRDAVVRRIGPIVLTTATTIAGLLPLAFSSSTL